MASKKTLSDKELSELYLEMERTRAGMRRAYIRTLYREYSCVRWGFFFMLFLVFSPCICCFLYSLIMSLTK